MGDSVIFFFALELAPRRVKARSVGYRVQQIIVEKMNEIQISAFASIGIGWAYINASCISF